MELGRSTENDVVPVGEPIAASVGEPMPAQVDEPRPSPVVGSGGGSGRVLVCDDTEQIRRLIRVNLELEGYEVVEAVDGEVALEILQDITRPLPDVITVDVVMPKRDGWWTVSTIRADPRIAHIPIIMVTASAQESDRAQALRADVNAFVAKPFDPDELLAKIDSLAGGYRV